MGAFLIFTLIAYGATMIIVQSVIMRPLREMLGNIKFFNGLLACMMCTGFWVSLILTLVTHFSIAEMYLQTCGGVGAVISALGWTTVITFVYLLQLAIENYFKIEW